VVREAVYCHHCGERLELSPDSSSSTEQGQPADDSADSGYGHGETATEPAASPAQQFRKTIGARLGDGEEPEEQLWKGGYASQAMIGAWCLSGLITIGLLVLAIWIANRYVWWGVAIAVLLLWCYQLLKLTYRRMSVRYLLTTQRFIHETGILRRVTDRIELIDVDDITFEQSILDRLVGVGTIRITSSDRTHPVLVLLGIADVKEVAGQIDETRRGERRRRGLHIESI
jgi:membrane protein YdbS with pleckstrin-like domain